MADITKVHEFAVKWCEKFKDNKTDSRELEDHYMADDCIALGFIMDCGHEFEEQYDSAAYNTEELKRIIDRVADIPLLGSAIFSRWRYFNHWACGGESICDAKNREWFITALTRLSELTDAHSSDASSIIISPDFACLKKEVEKLRTEMSMLLLEKDELLLVECKNIETAYMLALGGIVYKAYELNCEVLRLKRKIELIQAKKNRQEIVSLSAIEETLDEEFAEYKAQLDEQIERMNAALERSKCKILTEAETKELKKLYRSVVKALHPDLHPNISESQLALFRNAVSAYENGDLNGLRIISEMVSEPELINDDENGMSVLQKEKERLSSLLKIIKDRIDEIKSEYPYTVKPIVQSEEKIAEMKAELEDTISQLKDMQKIYKARIDDMLR